VFNKTLYLCEKLFWSIYFVLGIAVIGFVMGYIITSFFYFLSWILRSERLMFAAEYIQCWSIRFLLFIQPWLKCKNNFQNIYRFHAQYGTRKIVYVANHRSNLDTFLLISLIPGLRGMAKKSLFYNVFLTPMMLLIGFVPVQKGNIQSFIEGLKLVRLKILLKNKPALVFPETTRCVKNTVGVGKMSHAVFAMAKEAKALIVPIRIEKTDQVLGRGDFLIHPYHEIRLTILEPIHPENFSDHHVLSDYVKSALIGNSSLCS
jgi:1-acyl-sn-glycerol-3-phosphate acyltransferase